MKYRRFAACAGICAAAVSMMILSPAVIADDIYKTIVKGQAGQNQLESLTDAELPVITGNATYSAYLPLEKTKTVEYLVVDIDGLNKTAYDELAVTVDKIRIDGSEIEMSASPSVDIQFVDSDFNGTRIYIADESDYSFLPTKTTVNESIEIIFTVKGMKTNGPDFVDKHGVQPDTTEPSTEPSESATEASVTVTTTAPKTSGAELVTHESTDNTAETTVTDITTSQSSSSITNTTMWNNTPTVNRNGGVGLTTAPRTSGAPLTGEKGLTVAFAGLAVTAAAAIAAKIKRKKK